jgi:predicted DNA-binding transcriptional regulator AlpA
MVAGFSLRLAGAYNPESIVYLIVSTVLIMSGPPIYALINYCAFPTPISIPPRASF